MQKLARKRFMSIVILKQFWIKTVILPMNDDVPKLIRTQMISSSTWLWKSESKITTLLSRSERYTIQTWEIIWFWLFYKVVKIIRTFPSTYRARANLEITKFQLDQVSKSKQLDVGSMQSFSTQQNGIFATRATSEPQKSLITAPNKKQKV